jgi:hypothetical protein
MTFGYPISRVFYQDGLYKQYFERAIFEHHENNGPPYNVLLTRLGALNTIERRRLDPDFQPVQSDPTIVGAGGVYFPETQHHLSGIFREYWETWGGLQTYGYPLSEELIEPSIEDGVPRVVQYFERARFEHHPQHAGTRFEVLLGHLGREALAKRDVPKIAVTPQEPTVAHRDASRIGPLPVGEPTPVSCGFNFAFWGDEDAGTRDALYLDIAEDSGCTWLRIQLNWRTLQPRPGAAVDWRLWSLEAVIDAARARGMRLLINVSHPPDWARPDDPRIPADPEAFGAFMGLLAGRFEGKVAAWQVWNEPNIIAETNGVIDPAGFLPLLKAGSEAIRDADSDALVVFPGLAPNSMMLPDLAMGNLWYLESVLALNGGEAREYFDVLAVHAYGAGNDPDTFWPGRLADNPGWTEAPEFYFRSAAFVRTVMVNAGLEDVPIWLTEMGWPVGDYADTWGYGEWITEEMQAEYLLRAFEIMRTEWHWVDVSFVWHLNFAEYGGPNHPFTGFSLIRGDRQPRPAFEDISEWSAIWRGN